MSVVFSKSGQNKLSRTIKNPRLQRGANLNHVSCHTPRSHLIGATSNKYLAAVGGGAAQTGHHGTRSCSSGGKVSSRLKDPVVSRNEATSPLGISIGGQSVHSFAVDVEGAIENRSQLNQWISTKAIQHLQREANAEVKAVDELTQNLLEREATIAQEVDSWLHYQEVCAERRREVANLRWNRTVYIPLQQKVNALAEQRWRSKLQQRHLVQRPVTCIGTERPPIVPSSTTSHDAYLDYVNKQKFVSLDVTTPEHYYPFSLNNGANMSLKMKQRPTSSSAGARARNSEDRLVVQCSTGQILPDEAIEGLRYPIPNTLIPRARSDLNWQHWQNLKFHDIDSVERFASRARLTGKNNNSQMNLSSVLSSN